MTHRRGFAGRGVPIALVVSLALSMSSVVATAGTAAAGSSKPVKGGTLTFAWCCENAGFDPANLTGPMGAHLPKEYAVFDALALENATTGGVDYKLMKSAESKDNLTWTLKFRPNVEFSDETPFDAAAVKFNWDRLADPATKAAAASAVQSIASSTVVDSETLEVVLKTPNAQFPRTIAQTPGLAFIGSPTAIEAEGANFNTAPVGAGPFTLQEWVPRSQASFERNPNYYKKVYLDNLVIKVFPDETSRVNTFESGGADVMLSLDALTAKNLPESAYRERVEHSPPAGGIALVFNMSKPPFDDLRVRRAFAYALDGPALTKTLFGDAITPLNSMFAPGSTFYDKSLEQPAASDKKAQKLFDEIAAENGGEPLKVTLDMIPNLAVESNWILTKMQDFDNVEVTANPIAVTAFSSRWAAGLPDFMVTGVSGFDADSLYNFLHSEGTQNYAKIADPALDAAFEKQRSSRDLETRVAAMKTVQERVLDLVPLKFFKPSVGFAYLGRDFKGVTEETLYTPGTPEWSKVWIGDN